MTEEELKPLRLIYAQNTEILSFLKANGGAKLQMLNSLWIAKEREQKTLKDIAKQFGGEIIE